MLRSAMMLKKVLEVLIDFQSLTQNNKPLVKFVFNLKKQQNWFRYSWKHLVNSCNVNKDILFSRIIFSKTISKSWNRFV